MAIGFDLQRKQLLSNAISWLLPVIFFYIPLRLLGAILRSWRQFSPFYQADFITAFFVLVCVAFFRNQAKVLLWSFSVGVLLAFFYLLIKTWKFIYPLANPLSPAIRCSLQIVPELLLLQGAQYFYVLIDRIFVSFLPEGSISALAYAMTLAGLPPALIYLSGSFITVVSEHKTLGERSQKLDNLISMSIFLGVCTTCFMLLANQAIVSFAL
jgi:peptidoglycan biosynthesis protein MviN/MurJ (putative lipid II flippase)